MNGCLRLALAVLLFSVLALPNAASAAISSVTLGASVSPDPTSAGIPVSLSLGYDAAFTSGFTPHVKQLTFHLDNDIAFDTTGIPQCSLSSIDNVPRATALAACPDAVVGSGSDTWTNGSTTVNGAIDAFNGPPAGGSPTIYLHNAVYDSSNSEVVDHTVPAVLSPSTLGGDFGTQISFPWPNTGFAMPHLAVTLNNIEPTPGHHFWTAGCGDADQTLNYAGDFTYYDTSTNSATATQPCTPTGQRSKALKRCKKKHSKKARKKCRKKANRLPV